MPFHIGLLLFPDITQLDLTGPYEVFIKFPDAQVHLIWKTRDPVTVGGSMQIVPTTTFSDCPRLDLICVPGGAGMNPLLNDAETLEFIRRQAKSARYVTSVCTGALVLGAAGLLVGKRAATHWMSREMLPAFGATAVAERVVVDGNVITGGAGPNWRRRSSSASNTTRTRRSTRVRPRAQARRWLRRSGPPPRRARPSDRRRWNRPRRACARSGSPASSAAARSPRR